MVDLAVKKLDNELKEYEKSPETHPLYPEEWKQFWNRRYKELQAGSYHLQLSIQCPPNTRCYHFSFNFFPFLSTPRLPLGSHSQRKKMRRNTISNRNGLLSGRIAWKNYMTRQSRRRNWKFARNWICRPNVKSGRLSWRKSIQLRHLPLSTRNRKHPMHAPINCRRLNGRSEIIAREIDEVVLVLILERLNDVICDAAVRDLDHDHDRMNGSLAISVEAGAAAAVEVAKDVIVRTNANENVVTAKDWSDHHHAVDS